MKPWGQRPWGAVGVGGGALQRWGHGQKQLRAYGRRLGHKRGVEEADMQP